MRKIIFTILTLLAIMVVGTSVIIFISKNSPYRYCEECLYSNREEFDDLIKFVRIYGLGGEIKLDDSSTPPEIREILDSLKKQYQEASDYPVFTALRVKWDDKDNLYISIQVRKDRLKIRDGIEAPDVRCYSLVYIEPEFDGNVIEADRVPFYDNWRTWSEDLWSG